MKPRPAAAIIGSISALILVWTFYTWRFAYFWLDDFNNLFWVQQQDFARMLWYNINPLSDFFRPFGMLAYWTLWQLFDLNPLPYHVFAWILHAANVVLLYVLLSKIIGSRYGAAVGALFFGFRANFIDIYWSFGTIFELLACLLMLAAVLIYAGELNFGRLLLVALLYVFAMKSKEMAVTLPAVLFLYDICIRRQRFDRKRLAWYGVLAAFALASAYARILSMGSESSANPYYMDLSVITMGRGYGWYFDHLYGMRLRWGAWMIISVLLSAAFAYTRERRGLFFLGSIFIMLTPVIFLVNHRFEFFWYIPFFGVAGLAALGVAAVEKRLRVSMRPALLETIGVILFAVLGAVHYVRERSASSAILHEEQSLAAEYAAFAETIRRLPPPRPDGTLLVRALPRHLTPEVLTPAVQVILRRTDIRAEVVR
jgi:hypothetical protein